MYPDVREGLLDKKLASLVNKEKSYEVGKKLILDEESNRLLSMQIISTPESDAQYNLDIILSSTDDLEVALRRRRRVERLGVLG